MRTLIIGCLLGAGLVTAATAFVPAQDEDEFDDFDDSAWTDFIPPTKAQEKLNQEMDELLQGAWQLVEYETDYLDDYARHDRGVMMFGPGFCSFEMHISYDPIEPYPELPGPLYFQSGIFRYRFDDTGALMIKLVIGAAKDGLIPELQFERPGTVRVFEIEVEENRLVLSRDPGNYHYEFVRLRNAAHEQLDIFGRPIPKEDPLELENPLDGDDPEDEEPPKDDEEDS